jgi:hypothetical protein
VTPEWQQKLPDFVKRLEEALYKNAPSKVGAFVTVIWVYTDVVQPFQPKILTLGFSVQLTIMLNEVHLICKEGLWYMRRSCFGEMMRGSVCWCSLTTHRLEVHV